MREDFDSEWFGEAESLATDVHVGAVITILIGFVSINSIVQMFQPIHQVNITRDF